MSDLLVSPLEVSTILIAIIQQRISCLYINIPFTETVKGGQVGANWGGKNVQTLRGATDAP